MKNIYKVIILIIISLSCISCFTPRYCNIINFNYFDVEDVYSIKYRTYDGVMIFNRE